MIWTWRLNSPNRCYLWWTSTLAGLAASRFQISQAGIITKSWRMSSSGICLLSSSTESEQILQQLDISQTTQQARNQETNNISIPKQATSCIDTPALNSRPFYHRAKFPKGVEALIRSSSVLLLAGRKR